MNLQENQYTLESIEVTHHVETYKEDGHLVHRDVPSSVRVPYLRRCTTSWSSAGVGEAEGRAGQIEAFLVGLGIPLPAVERAEKLHSQRDEAQNALALAQRQTVMYKEHSESWKSYAQRLEKCVSAYSPRALKLQQRKRPSS